MLLSGGGGMILQLSQQRLLDATPASRNHQQRVLIQSIAFASYIHPTKPRGLPGCPLEAEHRAVSKAPGVDDFTISRAGQGRFTLSLQASFDAFELLYILNKCSEALLTGREANRGSNISSSRRNVNEPHWAGRSAKRNYSSTVYIIDVLCLLSVNSLPHLPATCMTAAAAPAATAPHDTART
jgi:hypothetical protein